MHQLTLGAPGTMIGFILQVMRQAGLEFMLKMESVLGSGGAYLKFQYLWGQGQEDL